MVPSDRSTTSDGSVAFVSSGGETASVKPLMMSPEPLGTRTNVRAATRMRTSRFMVLLLPTDTERRPQAASLRWIHFVALVRGRDAAHDRRHEDCAQADQRQRGAPPDS